MNLINTHAGGRTVARFLFAAYGFLILLACEPPSHVGIGHPPARWIVEEPPIVSIGEVTGVDPAYSLEQVSDVQLLKTGEIALANGRREVRIFSPGGKHLRTFGRLGGGPAELGFLDRMLDEGDTVLVVIDSARRRLLRFTSSGRLLSGDRIAWSRLFPRAGYSLLKKGQFLALSGERPSPSSGRGSGRGPAYLVILEIGGGMDTVGVTRGPAFTFRDGTYFFLPLGSRARIGGWDGGAAMTPGDSGVIRFLSRTGRPVAEVNVRAEGEEVTPSVISAWVRERSSMLSTMGRNDPRLLFPFGEEPDWPQRLPVYSRLLQDGENCVWAQRYPVPGGEEIHYDVVTPESGLVAEVTVPRGWNLRDILDSRLAAVITDDLGVQRVSVFSIDRGGVNPCLG